MVTNNINNYNIIKIEKKFVNKNNNNPNNEAIKKYSDVNKNTNSKSINDDKKANNVKVIKINKNSKISNNRNYYYEKFITEKDIPNPNAYYNIQKETNSYSKKVISNINNKEEKIKKLIEKTKEDLISSRDSLKADIQQLIN